MLLLIFKKKKKNQSKSDLFARKATAIIYSIFMAKVAFF